MSGSAKYLRLALWGVGGPAVATFIAVSAPQAHAAPAGAADSASPASPNAGTSSPASATAAKPAGTPKASTTTTSSRAIPLPPRDTSTTTRTTSANAAEYRAKTQPAATPQPAAPHAQPSPKTTPKAGTSSPASATATKPAATPKASTTAASSRAIPLPPRNTSTTTRTTSANAAEYRAKKEPAATPKPAAPHAQPSPKTTPKAGTSSPASAKAAKPAATPKASTTTTSSRAIPLPPRNTSAKATPARATRQTPKASPTYSATAADAKVSAPYRDLLWETSESPPPLSALSALPELPNAASPARKYTLTTKPDVVGRTTPTADSDHYRLAVQALQDRARKIERQRAATAQKDARAAALRAQQQEQARLNARTKALSLPPAQHSATAADERLSRDYADILNAKTDFKTMKETLALRQQSLASRQGAQKPTTFSATAADAGSSAPYRDLLDAKVSPEARAASLRHRAHTLHEKHMAYARAHPEVILARTPGRTVADKIAYLDNRLKLKSTDVPTGQTAEDEADDAIKKTLEPGMVCTSGDISFGDGLGQTRCSGPGYTFIEDRQHHGITIGWKPIEFRPTAKPLLTTTETEFATIAGYGGEHSVTTDQDLARTEVWKSVDGPVSLSLRKTPTGRGLAVEGSYGIGNASGTLDGDPKGAKPGATAALQVPIPNPVNVGTTKQSTSVELADGPSVVEMWDKPNHPEWDGDGPSFGSDEAPWNVRARRWGYIRHDVEQARQQRRHQVAFQLARNYAATHPGATVPSTDRLLMDLRARNAGINTESTLYRNGAWRPIAKNNGFSDEQIAKS